MFGCRVWVCYSKAEIKRQRQRRAFFVAHARTHDGKFSPLAVAGAGGVPRNATDRKIFFGGNARFVQQPIKLKNVKCVQ